MAYNFQKVYGSYEGLIEDPEVDVVHTSTPNGLHSEWACKEMPAGKHKPLENPLTANAEEAKILVQQVERSGEVLMEAFYRQFQPAAHLSSASDPSSSPASTVT